VQKASAQRYTLSSNGLIVVAVTGRRPISVSRRVYANFTFPKIFSIFVWRPPIKIFAIPVWH